MKNNLRKTLIATSFALSILFIILACTLGDVVRRNLNEEIQSKFRLTQDNIDIWGKIPGAMGY